MRLMLLGVVSVLALAGCGGHDWNEAWQSADGDDVNERIVASWTGCPEDDDVLLHLGWPPGTPQLLGAARQYVRDENDNIVNGSRPFQRDAELPPAARFSGYRRGDAELWLAADADEFVYVVFDDHVERWPRVHDAMGCD